MTTYRTYFSDVFISDAIGQITGSAAVSRLPSVPGSVFRLQAPSTNIGKFFVGSRSGTNQQYWEIAASGDTDWFVLSSHNLNQLFFRNPSGSSQTLNYWVQG